MSTNTSSQMKKGFLEFCILLIISADEVYASDILEKLQDADLLVVEGTLYPLLSRLKKDNLVTYKWIESEAGPPRKYYQLTPAGEAKLAELKLAWMELNSSINKLLISHAKSSDN